MHTACFSASFGTDTTTTAAHDYEDVGTRLEVMKLYYDEAELTEMIEVVKAKRISVTRWTPISRVGCLDRLLKAGYVAIRKLQFWLCFYIEDVSYDVEDLMLETPFFIDPPRLANLQQATKCSRKWLKFMYRHFKQVCPNGQMGKKETNRVLRLLFPNAIDTEVYAERLLYAFDYKRQGFLTFEDYILTTLSITAEPALQPEFAFRIVDGDKDNSISFDAYRKYAEDVYSLREGKKKESDGNQSKFSRFATGAAIEAFQRSGNDKRESLCRADFAEMCVSRI